MKLAPDFFNQLRTQIRISDIVRQKVSLTKKGSEYLGRCPFHSEKTPSFTVNDQKRFYHCFGCNAHGDVIKFTSETRGLSYSEAAISLAKENGIEIPKMTQKEKELYDEADHIYSILELAKNFFSSELSEEVTEYMHKRGISDEAMKKFAIGYARGKGALQDYFKTKSIGVEDLIKAGLVGRDKNGRIYEIFHGRIMFPILNIYNKVVGFGGRIMAEDSGPKYLNSPETLVFKKSETMYGENFATSAAYKKNRFILVEGYMDVIAMQSAGFEETVASLGTSVTAKHLDKLWRSSDEIIACLDGDNAGIRASLRLIDLSLPVVSGQKTISFVELPNSLDPDDVIKQGGSELFSTLLSRRKTLSEMIWFTEYQGKSFSSAESRALLEQKLANYTNQIQDRSLANIIKRYFKDQIWSNLMAPKKGQNVSKQTSLASSSSKNLLLTKDHSEIEVLESGICDFILRFPEIIAKNSDYLDFLESISFSSNDLNELRDWFCDKCLDKQHKDFLTGEYMRELAKNTRFYDSFLVESSANAIFLETSFSNNTDNLTLFFQWLQKRYYLLLLKQEYVSISENRAEDSDSKSSLYLEEIQKVSKELQKLAAFFVN